MAGILNIPHLLGKHPCLVLFANWVRLQNRQVTAQLQPLLTHSRMPLCNFLIGQNMNWWLVVDRLRWWWQFARVSDACLCRLVTAIHGEWWGWLTIVDDHWWLIMAKWWVANGQSRDPVSDSDGWWPGAAACSLALRGCWKPAGHGGEGGSDFGLAGRLIRAHPGFHQ